MNMRPLDSPYRKSSLPGRGAILFFLGLLTALPLGAANGLTVSPEGQLLRDGRGYRGFGVNYYDAFARTLRTAARTNYDVGFAQLAARRVPFARFAACGYWPAEMQLYLTNRMEFLRRLDGVVKSAEEHGVGLIPSLFWLYSTVPDLVNEPVNQWGNVKSRTHALMRRYVEDLVTRYRGSPAIWAWEFGNEFNLPADLPNAGQHHPPVAPRLGTPSARSEKDELTHADVRIGLRAFAEEIRRHDPERLILSGHAFPRVSAWHQMRERSWSKDTPEQFAEMLAADHPSPVNGLSVRGYEATDWSRLSAAMDVARREKKPLFVGEFGVRGPATPEQRAEFRQQLDQLVRTGVPLAALWVFDFGDQDGEWNVTSSNDRAYQLELLAEANRQMERH